MTNEQKIYNTAVADGMPAGPAKLAVFLVDQSKHETGNYTSRFFTVGNNAFGYSYNKNSKWQLDKGGPNADNGVPIAQYRSVENSVHEMTDWIKRRQAEGKFPADLNTITTPDQYAHLLKQSGYYGDTENNYAAALSRYFNSAMQNFTAFAKQNKGLLIGGIALLSIGIFAYIKLKKSK